MACSRRAADARVVIASNSDEVGLGDLRHVLPRLARYCRRGFRARMRHGSESVGPPIASVGEGCSSGDSSRTALAGLLQSRRATRPGLAPQGAIALASTLSTQRRIRTGTTAACSPVWGP